MEPGRLLGNNPLVGYENIDNGNGAARLAAAMVGQTTAPSASGPLATVFMACSDPAWAAPLLEAAIADAEFETVPLSGVAGADVALPPR